MQFGQPNLAVQHFRQIYERSPSDELGLELAAAMQEDGQTADAVELYRQILVTNPNFSQAANNLAWIYATNANPGARNAKESLRLALKVCNATEHRTPAFLDTLAAAYAEDGQFSRAVSVSQQAIAIAKRANLNELADQIRERLERYRQNEPHREIRSASP